MKPPKCRVCGGQVVHGNLYCSLDCGRKGKATRPDIADALTHAGFQRDPDVPNVWIKDGVAVTQESVVQHGLAEVLKRHGHVVGAK